MISILIPYGADGGWRDRAFDWNIRRWERFYPNAQICVAAPDEVGSPGTFNRPQAINRAAREATGDTFIIADADTTFSLGFNPVNDWVLPRTYAKLTQDITETFLAFNPETPLDVWGSEWEGTSWSGLLVIPRATFEVVGGFDERFTGWGHDDIAFGVAVDTLYRPHIRGPYSALHLWHPTPFMDNYGQPNNDVQRLLAVEYVKAAGDPDRMREVMG